MGLLDLFKKKTDNKPSSVLSEKPFSQHKYADSSSVSEDERSFYQPDEYYTFYSYPDSMMSRKVITFEERKKISYASQNGLYVPEILLLDYCKKGDYPKPKAGYPGLWWFEYGIRDVGHALESLEKRGFIRWADKYGRLSSLSVDELKKILKLAALPVTGKKENLIARIKENVTDVDLPDLPPKYELTDLGNEELTRSGYVPYMHKHSRKTTEDDSIGNVFNVWSINKLFPDGDASEWKRVVGEIEEKLFGVDIVNAPVEDSTPIPKKTKKECLAEREEIRKYLKSQKEFISDKAKTPGDGFEEESEGMALTSIGQDKEALVQFYIAIKKRFDAPALYRETAKLLRKYGMYSEELEVIKKGLKYVEVGSRHYDDLVRRQQKATELFEKEKKS